MNDDPAGAACHAPIDVGRGGFTAGLVAAFLSIALPAAAFGHPVSAAQDAATDGGVPPGDPGPLVAVGGGLSADNEAVHRWILDARHGGGPLCVVPTAGADPEASASSAKARFDRWGGEGAAIALPLSLESPEAAHDPAMVDRIAACGGFFFTGGVQSRILEFFLPEGQVTPVHGALMDRWRGGAVVAGSSAGAAMMSDPMIAGGPPGGVFGMAPGGAGAPSGDAPDGGVRLARGMGFLDDLVLDQHFLARGRIGRLVDAVTRPGGPGVGAGIDEDTALVIHRGELAVVGTSGVVFVDARGAGPLPPSACEERFGPIRIELLGPGDRVALVHGAEVRPAAGRADLPASLHVEFEGPDGSLFDRRAFHRLLEELGRLAARDQAFDLGMRMPNGMHWSLGAGAGLRSTGAAEGVGRGVDGTYDGLSVGPVELELRRIPDGGCPRGGEEP